MRFIICDDCGGYYKLEPGESLEDFSQCQCGGNLRYAQSFKEVIKNRNIPTKNCIYCGAENQETAKICSNCGKKLRRIESRNSDHPNQSRISDYPYKKPQKTRVKILDRISFLGVLAGIIFLILASIIAVFGLAGSIVSHNGVDVLRSMGGYFIIFIFAIIASGFIASYLSGTRDYVDGLLNGGMVGLALSLLVAFLTMIIGMIVDVGLGILAGLITFFAYLLIYGSLTAFGGLIAAWLRNNMENY